MKTDVLIIGGGPGGAATAMFLVREGIKPVILEQEEFPRYHIGESLIGEGSHSVRRLGLAEAMTKSGHPVKHGVKVFGTSGVGSWYVPVSGRDKDWNLSPSTTWQVRRSDFDTMMLKEAETRGATVMRGTATKPLLADDGAVRGVTVRWPDGKSEDIETQIVLDCSGQATFLANQRVTGPKYVGSYDKQVAFFSQVTGAVRGPGISGEDAKDNTLIFCGKAFICIGDAHRFIDPIFSFGLTVTMREAEFAAPLVREYLEGKRRNGDNPFAEHQVFCEKGIDNLEDMIDLFWEQPFAFATFVYHRYPDQLTDAFAGRIYPTEHQPSPAVVAFRKMLKRTREYDQDVYSVPIGSRFHPERAALWEPNSPVATTEQWMGAR